MTKSIVFGSLEANAVLLRDRVLWNQAQKESELSERGLRRYIITTERTVLCTYIVEAEDHCHARDVFDEGDWSEEEEVDSVGEDIVSVREE